MLYKFQPVGHDGALLLDRPPTLPITGKTLCLMCRGLKAVVTQVPIRGTWRWAC